MAISTGAAMLIGSGASAALGAGSSKETTKASKAALAEQTRQFDLSRADLAPYREVGSAALDQLASALGIEGYRTPEELAYTKYKKTRPTFSPSHQPESATEDLVGKSFSAQRLADTPLEALGGFGAVTLGKGKRKRKKILAAEQAAYNQKLADWDKEAARLKKAATTSVTGYDPAAATRARLETDPGYAFRLSEGEKALERSQAATTGVLGGRAVKESLRYNQDYSSNEYTNYINRLAAAAGIGQATSTTSAGIAANAGPANAAQINTIGSSKAGAYQSANNAIQGGLSNYMTMSMYDQLLKGNTATGAT